jgi:hypothetical protein
MRGASESALLRPAVDYHRFRSHEGLAPYAAEASTGDRRHALLRPPPEQVGAMSPARKTMEAHAPAGGQDHPGATSAVAACGYSETASTSSLSNRR